MSHAAVIDFEALSITARITCEEALKQLCKMDAILERINDSASELFTDKVKGYEAYLLSERSNLREEINSVIKKSMTPNRDRNIASVADRLNKHVNNLMTNRLLMIESVINDELVKTVNQIQQEKKERREGVIHISKSKITQLSSIDDFVLREEVYRLLINKNDISYDEALRKAKEAIEIKNNELININRDILVKEISEEMHKAGVETKTIQELVGNEIKNVEEFETVRQKASQEIIGEKVRKETLKVISKTIKSKGFIIDKKNIKIDRVKNEVKLIAKKASGERAEFRIYLDGKFIYKFDGYQGQACQEDLEPFINDLDEIYDIKVVEKTEIWSNPDKNSSMKYQTVNKNKGTN